MSFEISYIEDLLISVAAVILLQYSYTEYFSWKLTLDHLTSNLTFQYDHFHSVSPGAIYFGGSLAEHDLFFF